MDTNTTLLVRYARYHRDPRNVATHFVGIPLIVFSVGAVLSPLRVAPGGVSLSAAWLAWVLATLWYLKGGQRSLAVATSMTVGVLVLLAEMLFQAGFTPWWPMALGSFVVGWGWQFVGHIYEGRKPAFVDDLRGLLVGPMFMVAEAGFGAGVWRTLNDTIQAETGPVTRQSRKPTVHAG